MQHHHDPGGASVRMPRRALLSGLAILPLAPSLALAAEASPDAELLALGRQWEASAERSDRLCRATMAACERAQRPAEPEALFMRETESLSIACVSKGHHTGRRWYGYSDTIEGLRSYGFRGCDGRPVAQDVARRDEIVGAYDRWQAEVRREEDACGLTAADAAEQAAMYENRDLRRALMRLRASTLAGVMLKARVACWCHGTPTDMHEAADDDLATGACIDRDVMLNLTRDLVAMQSGGVA